MVSGTYNFILNQGTDHSFTVTYNDGTGNPIPLTDLEFRGEIRLAMSDSEVFANMEIEKVDSDQGQLKVLIPAYETSDKRLKSTSYDDYVNAVYDIEMTNTSTGETKRFLQGNIQISPEVTR